MEGLLLVVFRPGSRRSISLTIVVRCRTVQWRLVCPAAIRNCTFILEEMDVNKKLQGYVMLAVGFLIIAVNALSYVLDWQSKNSTLTILGIVFILMGSKRATLSDRPPNVSLTSRQTTQANNDFKRLRLVLHMVRNQPVNLI